MKKHFFDEALAQLALDSQSFPHHVDYWHGILYDFPNNKEFIYMAMNSQLFDWKKSSVFSEDFDLNPLTHAILNSDYFLDIIYYNKTQSEAEDDAREEGAC
jgi:hypothetical protein